jgi:glycerol-3-phosphate acyltransferase PlsY
LELAISFLAVIGAYLIGSLSFAVIVSRAFGLSDPRSYGSKNPGATNVLRSGNKGAAVATLLLDALKGWLPVWLAPRLFEGVDRSALQILCTLAVVAGHNWTCWLQFRGGKGIATSAGALLAMLPGPLVCALGLWGLVFGVWRYVSLASIAAALAVPVATWVFNPGDWTRFGFATAVGLVAVYRHKTNIQRLLAGTENRVGRSKPVVAGAPYQGDKP